MALSTAEEERLKRLLSDDDDDDDNVIGGSPVYQDIASLQSLLLEIGGQADREATPALSPLPEKDVEEESEEEEEVDDFDLSPLQVWLIQHGCRGSIDDFAFSSECT